MQDDLRKLIMPLEMTCNFLFAFITQKNIKCIHNSGNMPVLNFGNHLTCYWDINGVKVIGEQMNG